MKVEKNFRSVQIGNILWAIKGNTIKPLMVEDIRNTVVTINGKITSDTTAFFCSGIGERVIEYQDWEVMDWFLNPEDAVSHLLEKFNKS